eukprot:18993-Heterococcus_DN1.PRE.4
MSLPRISAKRRRRRSAPEAVSPQVDQLFSTFVLNRDKANSKYLPYDKVCYPKLSSDLQHVISPDEAAAHVSSLWVVGQIQQSGRVQRELLAKELQQFLGLPDSDLVPGAGSALRALSTLRSKSAYTVPPEQSGHTDANPKSSLTDIENLRLKDLERRLHLQSTGKSESLVRRCSSRRAYQVANRKMKNIMNGHGPNALTKRAGSSKSDIVSILHSAHVDDLYQRNRDERSAAIQLQAWWRHYSIRTKFELMARQG